MANPPLCKAPCTTRSAGQCVKCSHLHADTLHCTCQVRADHAGVDRHYSSLLVKDSWMRMFCSATFCVWFCFCLFFRVSSCGVKIEHTRFFTTGQGKLGGKRTSRSSLLTQWTHEALPRGRFALFSSSAYEGLINTHKRMILTSQ